MHRRTTAGLTALAAVLALGAPTAMAAESGASTTLSTARAEQTTESGPTRKVLDAGPMASRALVTDHQWQQTGYWCGPAATRHALTARGIYYTQAHLAADLGTHTGGTDHISQVTRELNAHGGGNYATVNTYNDPMTSTQKSQLWSRIQSSVNADRAIVANIISMPSSKPSHYPNSTIYHYFTISGYDTSNKTVRIVDSAFGTARYWLPFDQVARLIAGKGYSYHRS